MTYDINHKSSVNQCKKRTSFKASKTRYFRLPPSLTAATRPGKNFERLPTAILPSANADADLISSLVDARSFRIVSSMDAFSFDRSLKI